VKGGIRHRAMQTCPDCGQQYQWSPGLGLCPYCDLSARARQVLDGEGEPCPPTCCPSDS
jgi:hypothetical protein